MVHFFDEPGHQKLRNLLTDRPMFLLIEATQALLHQLGAWPDLQVISMTSLGMLGMSEGFHAKMSLLERRKSTNVLSYSEESVVPMCTIFPSVLPGSMRTSLEPSASSKDPINLLGSGTSSVSSFLMSTSSPEAMIVVV